MTSSRRLHHYAIHWLLCMLATGSLCGCQQLTCLQPKQAPVKPPVYMEYPYFAHHPTCWAQWPADWIGCPTNCVSVMTVPEGPFIPAPPSEVVPPPRPMDRSLDSVEPPLPPNAEPVSPDSLPMPAPFSTQPDRESSYRSPRLRIHATSAAVAPPPIEDQSAVVSASHASAIPGLVPEDQDVEVAQLDVSPRKICGSPKLARRAASQRCRAQRPVPPTLAQLIGAEVEQNPFLYSFVELGDAIRAEATSY